MGTNNRHIYYNPNPDGNRVGDCSVRALCRATGKPWDYIHSIFRPAADGLNK